MRGQQKAWCVAEVAAPGLHHAVELRYEGRSGLRSGKIPPSMLTRPNERVPALRGELTTLREVAASDVHALFTLFSDPAVTAHMAPPPPTLAKFMGFVVWSHHQRRHDVHTP